MFESSGQRDVVVHVRVAVTDFQICFTAMRLRGAVDQGRDEFVCTLTPHFIQGTEGALDGDAVREHVGGAQGLDAAKREHRRHPRRTHSGNGLLGGHNDGGRGKDRVFAQMRQGGVSPLAVHGQMNFVRGGHVRPAANADVTGGQLRVHVLAQNVGRRRVGQHASRHHALGASWKALLPGLEDAPHRSLPFLARGLEQLNGAKEGRGVHVVPTCVHDPWSCGRIRNVVDLLNGQGVHVGPKRDQPRSGIRPFHVGHNAGVRHVGLVFHTPFSELLGHKGHRFMLLEREFWMGMKVAAEGHPLRMMRLRQRLDARLKGHGSRVGLSWVQAV